MKEERKAARRFGDRYDGRRVRDLDPFFKIMPYVMRTRADAHVYFEDRIDIGVSSAWLRRLRDQGRPDIGFLHLFVAAIVRTLSQKPRLNRFIAGQKIYARNGLSVSLAIKKKLDEDSMETTVKLRFRPEDTIFDVADHINEVVGASKDESARNEADKAAGIFNILPGFMLRFAVWLLRCLDYLGIMPAPLIDASPFHASAFVTDLGSLGIKPIYHHIYDFGTISLFVAFGGKERHREPDADGSPVNRTFISMKFVGDERICDGHYYASAFRYMLDLFKNPESLERPPEEVRTDLG
ncbi:MAG: hypothetical protein JW923_10755 [Spirochaetales bacterium]|nr:hypothetical protein [Spirochaetales bacterium]